MADSKEHDYEVLIVGSGAGGGAMAYGLSRRKVNVLVLEAGPVYNPFTDYNLDKDTWETTGFPAKPDQEKERYTFADLQRLDKKRDSLRSWNRIHGRSNRGDRRKAYKYHHVRGVGGSTLAFTGEAHRLHPQSMQMQTRFGVAADWPVTYKELEPFYCEAEKVIGVAGPQDPGARWRSEPYPLPAHPLSHAGKVIKQAAEKCGYTWGPNSRAALSKPYDGRPDCNYCGNCNRGCPRTDKGSVDVTFLRKAVASGFCKVKSGINVTRVLAGPGERIKGVEAVDGSGSSLFFPAQKLVLSCGAIETPRLLLASGGLANESGLVGKNFMETVSWNSTGVHPDRLASYRGLPSDSICWDFNAPDAIDGIIGGCRFSTSVNEIQLNGPLAYATRVVGGWGRKHKAEMKASFGRAVSVSGIGESLPSARSYIDLDPEKVDKNGVPLARIHSHLEDTEISRIAYMAKLCREILQAAGVAELTDEFGTYDHFSSTHVFGTCRMGNDPSTSVVDSTGRSHRWKNLYLMDASVFPSSGGGESPSLTIEALALRSARAI